jgi:hypothetical protein
MNSTNCNPAPHSKRQSGANSLSQHPHAIKPPVGLDLECIAEQWTEVRRHSRCAADNASDDAAKVEQLIRDTYRPADGELYVAWSLNRLAQLMSSHHKSQDAQLIMDRARKLVAKELNQLDGFPSGPPPV